MFSSKKKEIAIKIKVQPEKLHYLLNEQIRANLVISSTAPIEIETITCFLNGYERSFDVRGAKPQENRKKFYEHGPTFIFKPEKKGKGMQLSPSVDHNIPFTINPIFRNISGSCLLDNKLGVIWQILVDVNLTRREASFSTTHEVHIHMGHQVYIQHAPQSSIVSVQKFFKHSPIEYRVLLHKTTFISNEAVSMTLDIKNQTRMDLISMTTELVQTWSSLTSRFSESLKLLKFDINSPPLFPIPPRTDRHKEIQFKLPERLPPSVVSISRNDTPVLISYNLLLEFLTNKSDKHQISIPILIEDNYPQREPLPPPVISPPLPSPAPMTTPNPNPNPNPNSLPQFSPTPDGSIQMVQPQYTTMPVMQMPAVAGSMYYNLPGNAQASMANFQQSLYPQIPANYQTPNLPVDLANGNQMNANNVRFSAPPLYPVDVNNNNFNNNNNNGTYNLSNDNGPLQVNVKDDLLAQELQYVDVDFGASNQNNNNNQLNHNSNPVMFDNNANNNNNMNYFVVSNDDQNNNNNDNNNDNNPNMSQNNYFGSNIPVFGYQIVDGDNNVQYIPYFQGGADGGMQRFTQVPDYGQSFNPQDTIDRPPAYNPNI